MKTATALLPVCVLVCACGAAPAPSDAPTPSAPTPTAAATVAAVATAIPVAAPAAPQLTPADLKGAYKTVTTPVYDDAMTQLVAKLGPVQHKKGNKSYWYARVGSDCTEFVIEKLDGGKIGQIGTQMPGLTCNEK